MKTLQAGVYAGIIAALVFGVLMLAMMPATIGKIAALYGASGKVAGFIIHLIHGGLIGGVFGIFATSDLTKTTASFYGLLYGALWWVLGPILIMPTWLAGGPRLSSSGIQEALRSLPGHLVFGLLLGLLFIAFCPSTQQQTNTTNEVND